MEGKTERDRTFMSTFSSRKISKLKMWWIDCVLEALKTNRQMVRVQGEK